MNIRTVILLFVALCISLPVFSQNSEKKDREQMRKEFREFKIKFISQEIELNSDQKKEFADLYSQMENERHQLFIYTRGIEKKLKKDGNATNEDYAKVSEALVQCKIKDGEIEKKYDEKFATFLSPKQIFKMKQAEDKFRRKMKDIHRKHRHGAKRK